MAMALVPHVAVPGTYPLGVNPDGAWGGGGARLDLMLP